MDFATSMQEKEKDAEEHRRNVAEYKKFLQSCDFIKVRLTNECDLAVSLSLCLILLSCLPFLGEQPVAKSSRPIRG